MSHSCTFLHCRMRAVEGTPSLMNLTQLSLQHKIQTNEEGSKLRIVTNWLYMKLG